MWKIMRRTCLVASIYGHGLLEEATQVRILCSMCGVNAAQYTQCALEMAVKALWVAMCGPAAAIVPVDAAVGFFVDCEGKGWSAVVSEFQTNSVLVTPAEYTLPLDPEPTVSD